MSDVTAAVRGERTRSVDVQTALEEAAHRVLLRDGPSAVTVRAVAAEAGVAPMGVYNHLGGKDGLVASILVRGFDGLTAAISAGDEPDPVVRLRTCGQRYRAFALENPQHYAVMFEAALPMETESPVGAGARDGRVHGPGRQGPVRHVARRPSAPATPSTPPSRSGARCTARWRSSSRGWC